MANSENPPNGKKKKLTAEEAFEVMLQAPTGSEREYWIKTVGDMSRAKLEESLREQDFIPEEIAEMSDVEAREVVLSVLLSGASNPAPELNEPADDSDPLAGFPESSIEVARPIPFRRSAMEEALAHHARIVPACEKDLLACAGHFSWVSRPLECVDELAAVIRETGGEYDVSMKVRSRVARALRPYRGIYRQLFESAGPDELYVIVQSGRVVSLRRVTLVRPKEEGGDLHFAWDAYSEVVAEPTRQHHSRMGKAIRTWSQMPGKEGRSDAVRAPHPPSSEAEAFERLLRLYEARIRSQLASHHEPGDGAIASIWTSRSFGDTVSIEDRSFLNPLSFRFPAIRQALEKPAPTGWLPVFIYSIRHGSVRWLALANATGQAPAPLDEGPIPDELPDAESRTRGATR